MPNVIQLLPDHIASKIAAGEVIQRPASVFKELVENSIDAQSTRISIHVKEGGKSYIQVTDNGCGMSPEDARMCFEKHATSKIKSLDDLFKILTKGFRGEALASIAAVSRVELKTKTADTELGTRIIIEDNKVLVNEPCACPVGTSITVQNLFFNIPARKNFLKDDAVEFKYIVDEFERIAIPHHNIQFTLYHNDKLIFNLPAVNNLFSRIEHFIENTSKEKFISIHDASTSVFELKAYIGTPDVAKKKRQHQMVFINQRYVKNNYLVHAVYEAFKGLIPPDYHPQFFLFFKIPPARIDWNIHPAKIEAKLLDEKMIYTFLVSVIKRGLGVSGITSTMDFSMPSDIDMRDIDPKKTAPPPSIKIDPTYNPFQSETAPIKQSSSIPPRVWEEYYKTLKESSTSSDNIQQGTMLDLPNDGPIQILECFQWLYKYIVCTINERLLIIDQQRAHEKIIYEKIKNHKISISSQTLMFPIHIELSANDFLLFQEIKEKFQKNGFQVEEFGTNSIILHSYPDVLSANDVKEVIENTIENFRLNQISEIKDVTENFYRSVAKSSAIKYGNVLTRPEMIRLVQELFLIGDYTYSPSGKKIFKEINREDINAYFKK